MSISLIPVVMMLAATPANAEAMPQQAVASPAPAVTVQEVVPPAPTPAPTTAPPPVVPTLPAPANTAATSSTVAPPAAPEEAGGIVVRARPPAPGIDPLQNVNAVTFSVVQDIDKALVGPAAKVYKDTVPETLRSGVRHVLDNLQEPVVFINYMLQLKPGKAMETFARFVVNSTIGVAGLIDVAKKKPFYLPRRPNGFAFTLGYYGVKSGPFLFLPIIGPTTVRDLFGRWVDLLVLPLAIGKPFNKPLYSLTTVTLRALDERAENDEKLTKLRDTDDPYAAVRAAYLANRQAEIDAIRGKPSAVETPTLAPPVVRTLPAQPEAAAPLTGPETTAPATAQ